MTGNRAPTRLAQCIDRLTPTVGFYEAGWPGLLVGRVVEPMPRSPVVYSPSLCVVAQGRKVAHLGDDPFEYNPGNYLLCSLPLPIESEILDASEGHPMLAVILKFAPTQLAKLLIEMEDFFDWDQQAASKKAVAPCEMTPAVHDALCRLLEALAHPLERRILSPGLERALMFEVLRGPNGGMLRHFVLRDSSANRVAKAVSYLEQNFRAPVDVKALAKRVGMSNSSLHEHFKRATSMSPIQFVKKMRLHEARAQLLGGRGSSEAAYDVGYSSPSQFSREFRRMFGHAPTHISASP